MKISVGAGATGAKISVFCQTQIQDKNIFHTSEHKNCGSDWSVKQHVLFQTNNENVPQVPMRATF